MHHSNPAPAQSGVSIDASGALLQMLYASAAGQSHKHTCISAPNRRVWEQLYTHPVAGCTRFAAAPKAVIAWSRLGRGPPTGM